MYRACWGLVVMGARVAKPPWMDGMGWESVVRGSHVL